MFFDLKIVELDFQEITICWIAYQNFVTSESDNIRTLSEAIKQFVCLLIVTISKLYFTFKKMYKLHTYFHRILMILSFLKVLDVLRKEIEFSHRSCLLSQWVNI